MQLKDDDELLASPVVANCRMNRERELVGTNSYTRDLGLNPVEFLLARLGDQPMVRWLDLCCGRGLALLDAAAQLSHVSDRVQIVGVDLVDTFERPKTQNLEFIESAIENWQPVGQFDLITCVHGLHYVADKIAAVSRAASWLTKTGTFVSHLDPKNLKHERYRDFSRVVTRHLKQFGVLLDSRRKVVSLKGQADVPTRWKWIGGDDEAGPNYTGQPAVNSWYEDSDK